MKTKVVTVGANSNAKKKDIKTKMKISGKKGIELDEMLTRRAIVQRQLSRLNKEFDNINKYLKENYEGIPELITPSYVVSGSYTHKDGYTTQPINYWTFKVFEKEG